MEYILLSFTFRNCSVIFIIALKNKIKYILGHCSLFEILGQAISIHI